MDNTRIIDLVNKDMNPSDDSVDIIDLVNRHVIPQGIEIPKPESIFELSGVPVLTKKSISTLIGKAKAGKTTATAWIVAQCIRQGISVLWIDTEQGTYYGSRTQSWVLNISGMDISNDLKYLDLKIFNPIDRFKIFEGAIKMFSPDLVIIDGIRDMVFDINDPGESTLRSGDLMRCAEVYECHILSVLHTNKGNDNARGHLGTEMINKSETVISVNKDESGNVVCSPEYTRSEPFGDFAFGRDSYGIPQLIEGYMGYVEVGVGKRSIKATDYDIEMHREMLRLVFRNEPKLSYNEFLTGVMAGYETYGISIGTAKAKTFIEHFKQQNIVLAEKEGKYTFYTLIS